jgi:Ran GTPase-activating protein 1
LAKCRNLKEANFSNIFISRLKEEIPISLKLMMDAIEDKHITHLDLSHNAFGPQGIESFEQFLSRANHLENLDVSNCGLSPKGGEMIAAAILKNEHMKLKEFAGTRSRLEEEGLTALADVFRKQKSIEKLDLTQNGSKRGLAPLLGSLIECKSTLRELYISDNKSINRAIPELVACIKECTALTHLNISDLNIKRKHISQVADALLVASSHKL